MPMPRVSGSAPPAMPPVDPSVFRRAMRNPACAVAVIAAAGPAGRAGMTATAVCALADSPPSVLVCVNRSSSFHGVIAAARSFSVNDLTSEQTVLAELFAGRTPARGEARFEGVDWGPSAVGAHVLVDALASFACERDQMIEHATHTLFIGRVVEAFAVEDRHGLVYSRGAFSLPQPIM